MAKEDRRNDPKDILDSNWQTPPNKPTLILQDKDHTKKAFLDSDPGDDGKILFTRVKRDKRRYSSEYRHIYYDFYAIISAVSEDSLELIFTQIEEVFDTYEKTPTAVNSHTYQLARVEDKEHSSQESGYKFIRDIVITLGELKQKVVYAT